MYTSSVLIFHYPDNSCYMFVISCLSYSFHHCCNIISIVTILMLKSQTHHRNIALHLYGYILTKCGYLVIKYFCIHTGNDITSMLLTQALEPRGCDDDDPLDKKPPKFDVHFNPKV